MPIQRLVLAASLVLLASPQAAKAQDPIPPPSGTIVIPGMRKLTITGQYRLRYEYQLDFDFRRNRGASNDFFTQRVRLNFAPEFTDTLSALIQIQDARDFGEETSTLDDSADGLDLHQAWLRVEGTPGISGTTKLGRQTVDLGDGRLVSALEWPSQGRSFDGFRHTWGDPTDQTLEAFLFQTREIRNARNDDALFTGLYASGHPSTGAVADLYAMFLHDDQTAAGSTENRLTLGTRWVQTLGELELGAEVATQAGKLNDADIPIGETAAGHLHATYRPAEAPLQPWVTLEANWASGNQAGSNDNERFDSLFPFAHFYYGYMDFADWENTQHFGAVLGGNPSAATKVAVYWHFFRTDQEEDAFGGPNGTLSSGALGRSRTLGNELDVKVNVTLDTSPAKTGIEAGYGVFLPGPATEAEKGDDDWAHFFYLQCDVRF